MHNQGSIIQWINQMDYKHHNLRQASSKSIDWYSKEHDDNEDYYFYNLKTFSRLTKKKKKTQSTKHKCTPRIEE